MFGAALPLLDTTIVGVAVDSLSEQFRVPPSAVAWTVSAYVLAAAAIIPASTWIGARFGQKRTWISSLALFLLGSTLCGLAWDIPSLVCSRVVQGIGGGLSMPTLQTLVVEVLGTAQARKAMATIGVSAVLAPIVGPVAGALILEWASWRVIFWVNIPLCVIALTLSASMIVSTPADRERQPFDVVGFLLLSPSLAAVVYTLSAFSGPTKPPWTLVVTSSLVAVAAGIAFAWRAVNRHAYHLIDVRLFASSTFRASTASLLLSGAVFFGSITFLPLWFQVVAGYSLVASGLALGVQGVGAIVSRYALRKLSSRTRLSAWIGWTLTALGTLPFALHEAVQADWMLFIALLMRGAGLGAITIVLLGSVYTGLEKDQVRHASALSRVAIQIGGALGVATLSLLLAMRQGGQEGLALCFWAVCAFSMLGLVPVRRLR